MKPDGKARLSAQNWIDIGLRDLSEIGPDALTIDALCRRAGKTKGSFYAHFDSHEAFLLSLAACWRERNTEALLRDASAEPTVHGQLTRLNHMAVRLDARLDQGMRTLAERVPAIAEAFSEVESTRIVNLARLHRAARNCSETEARDLATIEYAAYIGLQIMRPRLTISELESLHEAFVKLVALPAGQAAAPD